MQAEFVITGYLDLDSEVVARNRDVVVADIISQFEQTLDNCKNLEVKIKIVSIEDLERRAGAQRRAIEGLMALGVSEEDAMKVIRPYEHGAK